MAFFFGRSTQKLKPKDQRKRIYKNKYDGDGDGEERYLLRGRLGFLCGSLKKGRDALDLGRGNRGCFALFTTKRIWAQKSKERKKNETRSF